MAREDPGKSTWVGIELGESGAAKGYNRSRETGMMISEIDEVWSSSDYWYMLPSAQLNWNNIS